MSRIFCLLILLAIGTPSPADAQVDHVGTNATFEIATWNIEWFGEDNNGPSDESRQLQNAASVILDSGIDLWALQEIADVSQFEALVSALGFGWSSELAEISSGQRMAYVFDTDVVSLRSVSQILQNFSFGSYPDDPNFFASRPPLKAEFQVTLPDTTFTMTAINVHMKAFGDVQSWERRGEGAMRIKTHIDFTSLHNDPVVFLGDFNDELEGSIVPGRESPYKVFVDDPSNYFPATLELERTSQFSFIGQTPGSSIDHIIVSGEFLPLLATALTSRLSSVLDIPSYVTTTSDHIPVYAVFRDYIDTSVRPSSDVPLDVALAGVYPNPFISEVTASIRTDTVTDLNIELVDILGRVVSSRTTTVLAPGEHEIALDPGAIPAGAYFLRITSSGSLSRATFTRPVLKAGRR